MNIRKSDIYIVVIYSVNISTLLLILNEQTLNVLGKKFYLSTFHYRNSSEDAYYRKRKLLAIQLMGLLTFRVHNKFI
jgi:hypothetical protein